VSAVLPWLAYTVATGQFRPMALVLLLILAGTVSFWYLLWPAGPLADAAFLAILAAIVLERVFKPLYPSPIPKVDLSILGHIMLIRLAALAIFAIRGNVAVEFRFLPNRREWMVGLRFFAMMLPVIGGAYWALGLVRLRAHPLNPLLAIGTFLGILWVVALSEEFLFRGLLQQWLEKWTGSGIAALAIASLIFGSAHLGFHGAFPNWRFATIGAILGLFCGQAWRTTRSIQAGMVTHALAVTLWRVFFQ
jgi:membrane protease YdiL (CAAX protease family)